MVIDELADVSLNLFMFSTITLLLLLIFLAWYSSASRHSTPYAEDAYDEEKKGYDDDEYAVPHCFA